MKIKIDVLVQFFLIGLLGLGCSQHRHLSQKEKHLKTAGASSFQDSSVTKNNRHREVPVKLPADSAQSIILVKERNFESYPPFLPRTKLVPFREKAKIFWTCVGTGTIGGMVIGAVIGSSREPDYPSDGSGLATMVGMIYGSAIGCGAGAVVGILVAAKDGTLLLNDEASEEFWEKQ